MERGIRQRQLRKRQNDKLRERYECWGEMVLAWVENVRWKK
jgi:hypothetical protein